MGPSPFRERSCPQADTQENGDEDKNYHRKGWSESIGGVIYSKVKSMLENE
jgi:hypothetical protein